MDFFISNISLISQSVTLFGNIKKPKNTFCVKKDRYKCELLGKAMNAPSVLTMSVLLVFMSLLWFPLYDPYFS